MLSPYIYPEFIDEHPKLKWNGHYLLNAYMIRTKNSKVEDDIKIKQYVFQQCNVIIRAPDEIMYIIADYL